MFSWEMRIPELSEEGDQSDAIVQVTKVTIRKFQGVEIWLAVSLQYVGPCELSAGDYFFNRPIKEEP